MGNINKQVVIGAPVEAVFKFVADPHNAPRYISSITGILSGPDGQPAEGQVWRAEAYFLGRRSLINLRLQELRRHHAVRFTIDGEPAATLAMNLVPQRGGKHTGVSLSMDVPSVPTILLHGLLGGLLAGDLERLKRILES